MASVEATPEDLWAETLAVKLTGPAALTRALLPALRAARGRIVFVNAAPGSNAVPNWSAYTGSKAALRELADSAHERLGTTHESASALTSDRALYSEGCERLSPV